MPELIIIIGAARSGTKLLRDILSASPEIAAVPYDVNYIWRYDNEWRADDQIPVEAFSERNKQYIEKSLMDLARKAQHGEYRYLVEKTVSNVFRVPYIHKLFPEARFIHLVRDGRDVAESAARMWSAPVNLRYLLSKARYFPLRNFRYAAWYLKNALRSDSKGRSGARMWGPRYPGIEKDARGLTSLELASKQWSESVKAAMAGLAQIPQDRWITIKYEELVRLNDSLKLVLEHIGVTDAQNIWKEYRENIRTDRVGVWRSLPQEQKQIICSIQASELSSLAYTVEAMNL